MKDKVNLVIPAAGAGRRMRSFGPKGCIAIDRHGESIVCRQIRLLKLRFDIQEIIVVVGFRHKKLVRQLPRSVKVVTNIEFEETNVAFSVALGLSQLTDPSLPTIVMYGDLVFSPDFVSNIEIGHSGIIVDDKNQMRHDEVGVNVVAGNVTSLFYGLPTKWVHVAVLLEREIQLFLRESARPGRRRYFGYEILNFLIDEGGSLDALPLSRGQVIEVDSTKDITAAKKLTKRDMP